MLFGSRAAVYIMPKYLVVQFGDIGVSTPKQNAYLDYV